MVVDTVLASGNNYFSKHLKIEGIDYIGYYTPLENEDGEIVGMIFAGKSLTVVYRQLGRIMSWFIVISLISILISLVMNRQFSEILVKDINSIKRYLLAITAGDFSIQMDTHILRRKDEIGEIAENVIKMSSEIQNLIELDGLTTLYNRRTCNHMISNALSDKKQLTFVLGDIDYFKQINDTYGHDCGDQILVQISALMKKSVEGCGFAARWGGEEFLLVYETDEKTALEKTQGLLENIRNENFTYNDKEIPVTMTFGLEATDSSTPYETTIKIADDNLYKGKNAGRNQIVL